MSHTSEQNLLEMIQRVAAFYNRSIITALEFINKVFDEFAHTERVYPELVAELWEAIPETVRSDFVKAVRDAARPEFRYRGFYIGGGRPMSEVELQRDADLRTERVQAWAREFVRYLESLEA